MNWTGMSTTTYVEEEYDTFYNPPSPSRFHLPVPLHLKPTRTTTKHAFSPRTSASLILRTFSLLPPHRPILPRRNSLAPVANGPALSLARRDWSAMQSPGGDIKCVLWACNKDESPGVILQQTADEVNSSLGIQIGSLYDNRVFRAEPWKRIRAGQSEQLAPWTQSSTAPSRGRREMQQARLHRMPIQTWKRTPSALSSTRTQNVPSCSHCLLIPS